MLAPFLVFIRPDLTGLIIDPFVILVEVIQSDHNVDEQMPCFVKSTMLLV